MGIYIYLFLRSIIVNVNHKYHTYSVYTRYFRAMHVTVHHQHMPEAVENNSHCANSKSVKCKFCRLTETNLFV